MVKVEDLRPGSVVRLASGSPKMVVTGVQDQNGSPPNRERTVLVHVTWWSERLGIQKNAFAPQLLVYPRPAAESAEPAEPEA